MENGYKLFIGNLPSDVTEGELLRVFAEHGELLEVFIMGGERSRSGQCSAFVKYATLDACDRAINAVNLKAKIRSPDSDAIVVKYAKSPHATTTATTNSTAASPPLSTVSPVMSAASLTKRDSFDLGSVHPPLCKLFVGGLPPFVDRDDLIAIFCPFGHIDSVHLMQGKSKSGQACAFITYQYPGPAQKAIEQIAGKYTIDDECPPISVRFADSEVATTKKRKIDPTTTTPFFSGTVRT